MGHFIFSVQRMMQTRRLLASQGGHRASSYWFNQCKTTVPSNTFSDKLQVDVAVVGAGIFGTSTALRLIEEGKSVVLIDQGGVGQGVTGNSTCKITSLHRLLYA